MLELKDFAVIELSSQEIEQVEGGFIPLLIYGGWGIMLVCSAVALGLQDGARP